MKKLLLLFPCLFYLFNGTAQEKLSLKEVISQAQVNSIVSKQIENRFQNAYWRNFAFKRQFLP
ncbi:MAG: hypothetical protein ACJAQ2_002573, partial [Vicingaceae bacterium]